MSGGRGDEIVLIATYLEPEHVDRIRRGWDGPVLYEPDLLPAPRYVADHNGEPRTLTSAQLDAWRQRLAEAEISFDFDWWARAEMPRNCPRLRWVQATSAGIGGFVQRTGLDRTELVFTTAAGVHAVPLAEFAVAGALYFVKDIPMLLHRQRSHVWRRYSGALLSGRNVAVVGLGSIGRQAASAFHALGAVVTGVGRKGRNYPLPAGSTLVDTTALDPVLRSCDVLVLACPLTPETHHMLDRRRLALLPPTAVIVNVSRGPLIEQDALIDALRGERLAGAALDVFEDEPLPEESPLWDLPNVLVSPHSASTVAAENGLLTDLFLDNLTRWRDGTPLRNLYRRDVGY